VHIYGSGQPYVCVFECGFVCVERFKSVVYQCIKHVYLKEKSKHMHLLCMSFVCMCMLCV